MKENQDSGNRPGVMVHTFDPSLVYIVSSGTAEATEKILVDGEIGSAVKG